MSQRVCAYSCVLTGSCPHGSRLSYPGNGAGNRGHGQSEYDRDPSNYTFRAALADLWTVLTAFEVAPAILVGTSLGGVLAMMLGVLRPNAVDGVILNDIGPVIEPQGLLRIKSFVGKLPVVRNFEEGAQILRWLFEAQFRKLTRHDWIAFAQRTWRERGGRVVPDYDPELVRSLRTVNLQGLPTLWNEFDALAGVPLLVIRGMNSDVLALSTLHGARSRSRAFAGRAQGDAADCSLRCILRSRRGALKGHHARQ